MTNLLCGSITKGITEILNKVSTISDQEIEFEYLKNHILQDKYMYHHYWRDGDIILSDQDITLHIDLGRISEDINNNNSLNSEDLNEVATFGGNSKLDDGVGV